VQELEVAAATRDSLRQQTAYPHTHVSELPFDHERQLASVIVRGPSGALLGTRVLMLSGDDQAVAERVAAAVGVERVEAGATRQGKADVVATLHRAGDVVAMVGEGINDAPALALADVGIALPSRGATISSATADVVITVDDIARVAEAIAGGKRTLRIARRGIALGMGVSAALMVVAAVGALPPV
jgi:P-type E1-E2 ATPase